MRVLIAVHGHPRLSPGGGENAAYALHQQLKRADGVTSVFLAAAEDCWLAYGGDLGSLAPDEWLMRRSSCGFFYPSAVRLDAGSDLAQAIRAYQPDVIHLHHFVHLGLDLIHALRRWCPQARIVFTLHEFLSFCAFNGQLRRRDGRLCAGPSAIDCKLCLPERSGADLLLRDQLLRSSMALVDAFIAPSRYLIDRWQQWLVQQSITMPIPCLIDNLLPANFAFACGQTRAARPRPAAGRAHTSVFAYFGQLLPSKGIELLLDAWQRLVSLEPGAYLVIHGRMPIQQGELSGFSANLQRRLAALEGSVTLAGAYAQDQLPALMAAVDWVVMCSLWPENSPVVIQEARACGRPLLVPALGGMAEKVRDGWDGLHYTPHSALALSELMLRCCEDPLLWQRLRARQAGPPDQEALLQAHLAVYRGEDPVPAQPFPAATAGLVATRKPDLSSWLAWSELAYLATEGRLMMSAAQMARLRSLPGGRWQVELRLSVPEDGLWQLSMGWDGEWLEQRWLETSERVLTWGWLCPISPLEVQCEGLVHCLDWQLLPQGLGEEAAAARLIWADPKLAPAGLQPQAWLDSLNQLALLASRCGGLSAVALEGDPALLERLEVIWPLLQAGPSLDNRADWQACSTGTDWELRRRSG